MTDLTANGGQTPTQRSDLIAAARSVGPTLERLSAWAESEGRLHDDAIDALVTAGVPRLFLPRSLGGAAVDPATCGLVCEALADADPAAAWHVMVYNAARLMAARWPAATVEHLWGERPDAMVAASGHTPLTGVRTDSGFVVSGRNSFVSGCHHADFIMSPMRVDDAMYFVVVPAAAARIVDNWDTLGMRGTGSNDVEIDGVEIPAVLAVAQEDALELNVHYASDRVFRCPSRIVFATYIPAALSLARRSLDELTNLAQNKVPYATDAKLKTRTQAQTQYALGLAKYRSVRDYFFNALETVWARAHEDREPTTEERADLYLAGTHTMQTCAEIVRHVADAAGSSVFYRDQPLERIQRDMETLRHHGFANQSRYASVAQALWGAPLDYPLLLR